MMAPSAQAVGFTVSCRANANDPYWATYQGAGLPRFPGYGSCTRSDGGVFYKLRLEIRYEKYDSVDRRWEIQSRDYFWKDWAATGQAVSGGIWGVQYCGAFAGWLRSRVEVRAYQLRNGELVRVGTASDYSGTNIWSCAG